MKRLKDLSTDDRELTVLEKLLIRDSNPKTAIVMALDMFSAGVETVSITFSNTLTLQWWLDKIYQLSDSIERLRCCEMHFM